MDPVFAIDLQISRDNSSNLNLVAQIHSQLNNAILQGRLSSGTAIPSSRALAEKLKVSRNTVLQAYARLQSEGLLETLAGSGTVVANISATVPNVASTTNLLTRIALRWQTPGVFGIPSGAPFEFDFSLGTTDYGEFPFESWRRCISRQYRKMETKTMEIGHPAGQPSLRKMIAGFVSQSRAVSCTAEQIFICSGAQQAYILLAQLFIEPGVTCVAIESPGYPMARRAFAMAGARIFDIPVDREGLVVDLIPPEVNMVFVTPTHQFPTSVPLSMARRAALLQKAKQQDMIILEDDYDSEFRIGAQPIDALQTLDSQGRVFYIGTFSKSMFLDMRTGFIVAPEWSIPYLASVRQVQDWRTPVATQLALAEFMQSGELRRHIFRMNRIYSQKYHTIVSTVKKISNGVLTPTVMLAGMHLTLDLDSKYSAQQIVRNAAERSIKLHCGSEFSVRQDIPNQLMLGLGRIPQDKIEPAIHKLMECIK